MFTGIVQSMGKVEKLLTKGDALQMTMRAPGYFKTSKPGDSVANNGVCLTVESCTEDTAQFTLIHQTLLSSAFQKMIVGSQINLELPCKADSLMGGHYVMGHVDGVAEVSKVIEMETGKEIWLKMPEDHMKYVIGKGSITLNGISLTVAEKAKSELKVALIPETLTKTNAGSWDVGTIVNFEVDMIGKYLENYLRSTGILDALSQGSSSC